MGALHFIWKLPENISEEALVSGNLKVMEEIKSSLPVFHTRMRKQFLAEMSLFNPAVLREMYRRLTGNLNLA